MKKLRLFITVMVALILLSATQVMAQDEEKKSNFSVGADLYTNYIWRGTKFGTGPPCSPA